MRAARVYAQRCALVRDDSLAQGVSCAGGLRAQEGGCGRVRCLAAVAAAPCGRPCLDRLHNMAVHQFN